LYAGGKLIGDMHQILKYENGVESTDNYEAWANAAFIVRAVNSHAALVEALLEGMGDTDGWKAKAAGALALAEGKGEWCWLFVSVMNVSLAMRFGWLRKPLTVVVRLKKSTFAVNANEGLTVLLMLVGIGVRKKLAVANEQTDVESKRATNRH